MKNLVPAFVAAALLGAAAIVFLPAGDVERSRTPGSRVVNPPDLVTADAAAWRAAFPLEPPDVPFVLGVVAGPGDQALAAALVPFRAGRYQEAAPLLEQVHADYPDVTAAALSLGIARLFTDEIPNGIEILRRAQASPEPAVASAAQWYALVGIARLREPGSGIAEVREVCERPGPFQGRACAALESLKIAGQPVAPHH
jgi:hypothetical protein